MMRTQGGVMGIAGVVGALGVILGAFGAHGLEAQLDADALAVWHTAVLYHLFHAAALLGIAAAPERFWMTRWLRRAAWAWVIGVAVFSGSLYLLALTGVGWLGAITPIGGVAFIIGWVLLWPAGRAASVRRSDATRAEDF